LTFAAYELTWTATTPLALPDYAGSTLRGAFGGAFRRVACTMRDTDCEECLLRRNCAYPTVFETKEEDERTEAARPFVIEPPLEGEQDFAPGEAFAAGLALFGRALETLPYFLVSFRELGRRGLGAGRGKCELTELTAVHPFTGARAAVYTHADQRVRDVNLRSTAAEAARAAADRPTDRLTVNFLTFTRLKYLGHFVDRVEFPVLISRLLGRVEALTDPPSEPAPWLAGRSARELIHRAKEVQVEDHPACWQEWTRYSSRQDTRMKMGGVVGRVTYAGDLAPFLPLLVLGQFTHVGKGAVFGLGKYRIEGAA
jgi:hypothetical protein